MGYGTQNKLYLKGGVLENRPEFTAREFDKKRRNFRIMLSRYLSSPMPDIEVIICLGDEEFTAITDEYGYFSAWVEPEKSYEEGWHQVSFKIRDEEGKKIYEATGKFLVVDDSDGFGIISDIDDTVLVSHATQVFRKLRLIMTKNAKTRLPFNGVAELYQKLKQKHNPFFYVSSSEWNLYDFLVDFFRTREIPEGPFLLQEYKSGLKDLIFTGGGSHQHKQEKIKRLMRLFPQMKFVLIGDSGQRDTEIYKEALLQFPDRILSVYIRKIGKKDTIDNTTLQTFAEHNVPLLMMKDSQEALDHARSIGLIAD